jgi:uncharacterized membrane protein YecN with MAPEG domain
MEGNDDVPEKTREIISNLFTDSKISLQENDNELFRIDVTGRESKNGTKCTSDEDGDESYYTTTVRRNLLKVDTLGQDGDNQDLHTDYDSDDNCVKGNIIFIKCTYVCTVMSLSSYLTGLFLTAKRLHMAENLAQRIEFHFYACLTWCGYVVMNIALQFLL